MALAAAELAQSRPTGPRISPRDDADVEQEYLPVERLRRQYLDYVGSKIDEIEEQRLARRYYHGSQADAEHIRILRDRHQPWVPNNKVARKVNGISGLIERMRFDPKAQPNKPKAEDGASVATQSIRSVLDGNDWKTRDPFCLLQCGIDGIAGIELKLIKGDHGDPDVGLAEVLGDEYFYNPQSVRFDFADVRYEGIAKWLDLEEAVELFPEHEETLRGLIEAGSDLTTNADREHRWIMTAEKRIRLIEHWYKYKGQWCWAFYVANFLLDEGISPFKDEKGKTFSRFIMFAAAVDHDGDRYGFIRNLKGLQDEVNQRRSKALHISNSRRLIMEKGAVDDVETARREWARPDGIVEKNPGRSLDPDTAQSQADLAAQFQFLEEAKNEIEQYGNVNVAAMAPSTLSNLSGRAIELLRQPGMAELGPFILSYRGWKLRVYRAIWNIITQYWTAERWVRVTDNEGLAQFIKLNGLELDQFGRPAIVNHVGTLDVDITLEEGPDISNLMQDTYDALKGYPPGTFPPQVLIEMSPIPRADKDRFIKMMAPQQAPPDPAAELAKQLSLQQVAAQNADLQADTEKKKAEALKTHASVEQVLADAALKRSGIVKNEADAAQKAFTAHLNAGDFALRAGEHARDNAAQRVELGDDGQKQLASPPVPAMPPLTYPPPF